MILNLGAVLEKMEQLRIKKKEIIKHPTEPLKLKISILEKIENKNHQLY